MVRNSFDDREEWDCSICRDDEWMVKDRMGLVDVIKDLIERG